MSTGIITRFAPSPTGFLHIGGARTALFNWLFAKANNGKMKLRIEDTDRKRYNKEAVSAILDGLSWLGLDWDGDPISQFERRHRHVEIALKLLDENKAYYCYATMQELEEMRQKAKMEGRLFIYDGRWRNRDANSAPKDISPVIRIKTDKIGITTVNDRVQGQVQFSNENLDDFILLRSDGTPTYMLAVVVDDHDMNISHIIRGDDHLTNTARQIQIYKALGWRIPEMTHIPLIHGSDGAKLSKRHGAMGVETYRELGYLSESLRNYLVRLGWSHGNHEVISTTDMIKWFNLEAIGKSPARFDFTKLESLNSIYIRQMTDESLLEKIENFLASYNPSSLFGKQLKADHKTKLLKLMPALKTRAKTLKQLIESAEFIAAKPPLKISDETLSLINEKAIVVLSKLVELFQNCSWTAKDLEKNLKDYANSQNLKFKQIAQPLRIALTGSLSSPGVYDILTTLGREESLKRIVSFIQSY